MSDIAAVFGIKDDASRTSDGGVFHEVILASEGRTEEDFKQARDDFFRIRLRGQLPGEVDRGHMIRQAWAAAHDASATLNGFCPRGSELMPFVLLDEVTDPASHFEARFGYSPLRRARLRLAFDYIMVFRKHSGRSYPQTPEAYRAALLTFRDEVAEFIGGGVLDAASVDDLPWQEWIDNCRKHFCAKLNQPHDYVHDIVDAVTRTHGLSDSGDPDREEIVQQFFDIGMDIESETESGVRLEEALKRLGFPRTAVQALYQALFRLRSLGSSLEYDLNRELNSAFTDAIRVLSGSAKRTDIAPLPAPIRFAREYCEKTWRDGIGNRLSTHVAYAFILEALSSHAKRVPTTAVVVAALPVMNTVQDQLHEVLPLVELEALPSETLHRICGQAVQKTLDKITID